VVGSAVTLKHADDDDDGDAWAPTAAERPTEGGTAPVTAENKKKFNPEDVDF
jgi:hypothetical protein